MIAAHETEIDYVAGGQHYRGLLLRPSDGQARAAVVLLPDWRGQSPLAREHAGHLVGLGAVVVIADLYGDGFSPDSPDQVGPMVKRLIEHRGEGLAALAACVERLRREVPVVKRLIEHRGEGLAALAACVERLRREVPDGTPVLCLGYSAGGMVALDYGRSGADIAGIILCSALLKTAAEGMPTRIPAPVLILQGTEDQVSPMETIAAVIAEMDAAGNDVRFELYSQTHHAFDNPDAGNDPNARLCYSATSARRARAAIAAFLAEVAGGA